MHGYARATLDVDIFIRPTPENAQRTRQALTDFGYDLADVTHDELLTKKVLIRSTWSRPTSTRTCAGHVQRGLVETVHYRSDRHRRRLRASTTSYA